MATKKDKRFINGEEITLEGVELRYPYLITPDTKYRPQWSTEVLLSDATAKELSDLGLNVKTSSDGGGFIKVKKYCQTRAGKELEPPLVVGLNPTERFTKECGSGTIANVKIWVVYRKINGVDKLCAYLSAVQVIDHKSGGGFTGGFDDLTSVEDIPF